MRRLALRALVGLAGLLVVAATAAIALVAYVHTTAGERRARLLVERAASERTGARVRLEHLGGSLLFGATVDGLTIQRPGARRGATIARVERVALRWSPLALLALAVGRLKGDVDLEQPTLAWGPLRAQLAATGAPRVPGWLRQASVWLHVRAGPLRVESRLVASRSRLAIERLTVEGAGLRLLAHGTLDRTTGRVDATLETLSLAPGEPPLPHAPVLTRSIDLRGTAKGPLEDVRVVGSGAVGGAPVELHATVDGVRRRLSLVARVDRFEPPIAESEAVVWSLRLTARGALTRSFDARLDGEIDGRWRERPYDPALASLSSARARRIAARLRPWRAGGRLDGALHLHGGARALGGEATVRVESPGTAALVDPRRAAPSPASAHGPASASRGLVVRARLVDGARGPRLRVDTRPLDEASGRRAAPSP